MPESVTINVGGMVCAACQVHVQKALDQTKGVSKAAVNLMTGQAQVSFDPQIVEPEKLLEAIRDTGYEAQLPTGGQTAAQEQLHRDEEQSSEARDLAVKAGVSFVLGVAAMAAPKHWMHQSWFRYVLAAATVFVMSWAGRRIYAGAWKTTIHGSADMNALVALGTGAAFLYSLAVTIDPAFFEARSVAPDVYYEAAILILAFVTGGRAMEERAKRQTAGALRKLIGLQPSTANVLRDGAERSSRSPMWPTATCWSCGPATDSRRRRSARRVLLRGRIDADGRAGAGYEIHGRCGDRRHGQYHRQFPLPGHFPGRSQRALAHRFTDAAGARLARAD